MSTDQYRIEDSHYVVQEFLTKGITFIDGLLGDGYTEEHPELLAAYVQSGVYSFFKYSKVDLTENSQNF
jgi:hypothetical protein